MTTECAVVTEPLTPEEEQLLKDLRRRKAKQIRDVNRKYKFSRRKQKQPEQPQNKTFKAY